MQNDLTIERINGVFIKLNCEPFLLMELSDIFTFNIPNFKFMKKFKNASWDGKIRLVNTKTKITYAGLIDEILNYCKIKNYSVNSNVDEKNTIQDEEIEIFLKTLNLPEKIHDQKFSIRDYQINCLKHGANNKNSLFLSPTSSGKSLMIYLMTKWFKDKKTLIIVPTTSLIHQLVSDFKEYGSDENYHKIFSGQEKENINDRIIVSTWQSLYEMPEKWFHKFDMVIGDEAHLYKATSLKYIMENLINCHIRFGFTGTLDESQTNEMVLKGLFGPIYKVISIKNLVENKQISNFQIKCITLKHSKEDRKNLKIKTYQDEIDYLISNEKRNTFIRDLSLKLKGNTIIFYQYVDRHGKILENEISKVISKDRKLFFISGEVDGTERNSMREIIEKEEDCIIVASYGTTSTGINIRKIRNLIFASPSKSKIRVLQSIGRGLRLSKDDSIVTVFDLADMIYGEKKSNYTLRHLRERINIYNQEEFTYKMYSVDL